MFSWVLWSLSTDPGYCCMSLHAKRESVTKVASKLLRQNCCMILRQNLEHSKRHKSVPKSAQIFSVLPHYSCCFIQQHFKSIPRTGSRCQFCETSPDLNLYSGARHPHQTIGCKPWKSHLLHPARQLNFCSFSILTLSHTNFSLGVFSRNGHSDNPGVFHQTPSY